MIRVKTCPECNRMYDQNNKSCPICKKIRTMREELHESGWSYVPGSGWALSRDIAEDSTGNVQYYGLEEAHDIEMADRQQKQEAAEYEPDPLDDIAVDAH